MSYDPSYRMPPRQERWPNATPAEGWPSYRDGRPAAGGQRQAGRHAAVAAAPFPPAGNGYGGAPDDYGYGQAGYEYAADSRGYPAEADSFDGYNPTEAGYGPAAATGYAPEYAPEYDWAESGYAGTEPAYAETEHGYAGTEAGYAAGPDAFEGSYVGPGSYIEPDLSDPLYGADPLYGDDSEFRGDPLLMAPDAGARPDTWRAGLEYQREASGRRAMVGAVMEVLAIAVVIGVSTLAAGLLKARTSPIDTMGTAFIQRTPAAVRTFALHHFGAQGRTVLLLGMYAAFAVVAIVVGVLARRSAAAGVAGVAAFTLFAAFVVVTRPGGRVADVAPVIIGGAAGVAALLWLYRASAPPLRPERGVPPRRAGTRRKTR